MEAERRREEARRAVLDEAQRGVAQVQAEIDDVQDVEALDERFALLSKHLARLKAFTQPQGVLPPNNAVLRQARERYARVRDETIHLQHAREREAERRAKESMQERQRREKREAAFDAMQARAESTRRRHRGTWRAPHAQCPLPAA